MFFRAQYTISPEQVGQRLDQALATLCPEHSRVRLTNWLKEGHILVNGEVLPPRTRVEGEEVVEICAPLKAESAGLAEAMPLDIVYEDDHILVINKQDDLVVHPGAGNADGTLLNGLLYHCPSLEMVPRAGIVHRLDKGTTGLMVVAKTLEAHTSLVEQLQSRTVKRTYTAVVLGSMISGGDIDAPIGRDPHNRIKMAIVAEGKEARTQYRILEKFPAYTCLSVQLETGRTHQIRVHMASIGHPLVGDRTYERRQQLPKGLSPEMRAYIGQYPRPALHARALTFLHPATGLEVHFEAPVPLDMKTLLLRLREAGRT